MSRNRIRSTALTVVACVALCRCGHANRKPFNFQATLEYPAVPVIAMAPGAGVQLRSAPGDRVRKGQVLFEYTPNRPSVAAGMRNGTITPVASSLLEKALYLALRCQQVELSKLADSNYTAALKRSANPTSQSASKDPPGVQAASQLRDMLAGLYSAEKPELCVDLVMRHAKAFNLDVSKLTPPPVAVQVTSPVTGQIEVLAVNDRDRIHAGQPTAAVLDFDQPTAIAALPQAIAVRLVPGQRVLVRAANAEPVSGVITDVSPADSGTAAKGIGTDSATVLQRVRVSGFNLNPRSNSPGGALTLEVSPRSYPSDNSSAY